MKEQLEEYNRSVIDQRNQMGRQLEANNDMMRREREAKEMLQAKLEALQAKVMGGGRSPLSSKKASQPLQAPPPPLLHQNATASLRTGPLDSWLPSLTGHHLSLEAMIGVLILLVCVGSASTREMIWK